MAKVSSRDAQVNARIVYWGVEGAGKTANLHAAYAKLRPDHRGELRSVPTRLDPSVSYEVLPIELGDIAGVRTQIELIAVPGPAEHAPTRKQLLDEVDGVVFVVDSQPERIDANIASFEELRRALRAYGRQIEDIPLVVQYNKRDLADPYALEDLHRKLDVKDAVVFEAVATDGTGVLQTLSTISKRVIRILRESGAGAASAPVAPVVPAPTAARATELRREIVVGSPSTRMERAILEEAEHPEHAAIGAAAHETETLLDGPAWEQAADATAEPEAQGSLGRLHVESTGRASLTPDGAVRVELVLADEEGRRSAAVLTFRIDPLLEDRRG
jgi:signal recognition particle receptor subunit beta